MTPLLRLRLRTIFFITVILVMLAPNVRASSTTTDSIAIMEKQIHALQQQLTQLKIKQEAENRQVRAQLAHQRELIEANPYASREALLRKSSIPDSSYKAGNDLTLRGLDYEPLAPSLTASTPEGILTATPPAHPDLYKPLRRGQLQIGGVRLTLGGFLEAATIWRSRHTGSDISTGFNAIPWGNQPPHHMSEFRQSERQSRLSLLVEGMITKKLEADAYIETDFQGSGSSSNSRQSNSYVPRARVVYGELKDEEDGLYFLGGQSWSLITLFNKGMFARDEQTPLVIEAQYVPGFNWTRNPQLRIVKTFGKTERYALGLSVENPSAVPAGKAFGHVTDHVSGTNVNNPDTFYTTDPAPDLIAKLAADPGWGHYEITGIMRFFRSRSSENNGKSGDGQNHTIIAGGGGGGMILPLISKVFYLQASGLVGQGLGRYGSANMPDYTYRPNGGPVALPEANLLVGLYGMPTNDLTLYSYVGAEKVLRRKSFDKDGDHFGYGNHGYDMSGCHSELSTACAASGNVQTVAEATAGFWYTAAKGDYGTIRIGGQYAHTYLRAFSGIGGRPHTDADMFFMSFRYMPFN